MKIGLRPTPYSGKVYSPGQRIATNALVPALGEKDGYATDVFVIQDMGERVHVRYGCWLDQAFVPKSSIKETQ